MTPVAALSSLSALGLDAVRNSAPPAVGMDFTRILDTFAASAVGDVKTAETAAMAGIEGNLPIAEVVDAVMQAERSLQTALAIRDKVVSAYLEMTRMQI